MCMARARKAEKSKWSWRHTGVTCHAFWGPHCDQYAWMGVLEQEEVRGGQNNALMVAGDRVWARAQWRREQEAHI